MHKELNKQGQSKLQEKAGALPSMSEALSSIPSNLPDTHTHTPQKESEELSILGQAELFVLSTNAATTWLNKWTSLPY